MRQLSPQTLVNQKAAITVVSTYSVDKLLNQSHQVVAEVEGGPALFIGQALRTHGVPYHIVCGDKIEVEILITPDGEYGKVPVLPEIRPINEKLLAKWAIVSTVLNEWQFMNLEAVPDRLFIDVQGFVRNPVDFGSKQRWDGIENLSFRPFGLKASDNEIHYLPPEFVEDQKKRLLLVTRGAEGADVYYEGRCTFVEADRVENLDNTIGAGDTFLGFVVAAMYTGKTAVEAAMCATEQTAVFLRENKHFTNNV